MNEYNLKRRGALAPTTLNFTINIATLDYINYATLCILFDALLLRCCAARQLFQSMIGKYITLLCYTFLLRLLYQYSRIFLLSFPAALRALYANSVL